MTRSSEEVQCWFVVFFWEKMTKFEVYKSGNKHIGSDNPDLRITGIWIIGLVL